MLEEICAKLILDILHVPLLEAEALGIQLHSLDCLLADSSGDWKVLANVQVRWCRPKLVELHGRLGCLP